MSVAYAAEIPNRSIDTFEINRERAIDYLNTRENVYVFDGYAGVSQDVLLPPPKH